MKYDVLLFDLDGTLTESGIGITRSVAYALRKQGIDENDQAKLDRFVGPPLIDSYIRFYGWTPEQARRGVDDFREYFERQGMFENRVYDGVMSMLEGLKTVHVRCVVATSKPEQYAIQILDRFGLLPYFERVAGATMDETRTDKAEVIAYALESIEPDCRVLMVGDREHDIHGAKVNGLDSVGVLYGYGSREELEAAGATYIAEKPEDILKIVL